MSNIASCYSKAHNTPIPGRQSIETQSRTTGEQLAMIETERSIAARENFSKHVRAAQKYPMLSQEEKFELACRWRSAKDQAAADKLATSHIRLVVRRSARLPFRAEPCHGTRRNHYLAFGS